MIEYWETRFKEDGAMWQFEPADSARFAMNLFRAEKMNHILIPGMGYGRNAKLFHDNGFQVTGIEISQSAIDIARLNGMNFNIHHGSVLNMPFDNIQYDGIFCYALIHLLNKPGRKAFIKACYNQLKTGGVMIFTAASRQMSMYGSGKYISTHRYQISNGLSVYFYDNNAIEQEFSGFGLTEYTDIEEPVKFMKGQDPLKLKQIICIKK